MGSSPGDSDFFSCYTVSFFLSLSFLPVDSAKKRVNTLRTLEINKCVVTAKKKRNNYGPTIIYGFKINGQRRGIQGYAT